MSSTSSSTIDTDAPLSSSSSSDDALSACYQRQDQFSGSINLRIGGIFIILVTSLLTTLLPIITHRIPKYHMPAPAFDFAKYFGSGVIIATAFLHLLAPSVEELSSPCLNKAFGVYTFAFAFAMISMFMTFFVELMSYRLGSELAQSIAHIRPHHHATAHGDAHSSRPSPMKDCLPVGAAGIDKQDTGSVLSDKEGQPDSSMTASAAASQILGVMILEFGVIFHSVIIGITLGSTSDFTTLFIVIIFHQAFEGLGLGARFAFLPLKPKSLIPYLAAVAYTIMTPLGMAIGLGIRQTYNEDSATSNYVTGIFDSISAGILLYAGLVDLLAHEFIFNDKMRKEPIAKVVLAVAEMWLGAGIMALLARWA